jgi:hypothetical protein
VPPGAIHDSYRTNSPLVSGAVFRNLIRSPNSGLAMTRPSIVGVASGKCLADYVTGGAAFARLLLAARPKLVEALSNRQKPQPGRLDRVEHVADIVVGRIIDLDESAE